MTDFVIHIFDPHATAATSDGTTRTHPHSISDSAVVIGELASAESTGVCCLVSAGMVPDSDALATAVSELISSNAAVGILPDPRHSDLAFAWSRLPAAIASFVTPPESRGAVLLDTSRLHDAPSKQVNRPVQELVIRAALQHQDNVVLTGSSVTLNDSPLPSAAAELPVLAPQHSGRGRQWIASLLQQFDPKQYINGQGDSCEAEAILAGLLQLNDYLDESHNHSQSIQGQGQDVNGDYWHGIMHRREPDYGNAKYWFRKVGSHPCFKQLPALAQQAFDECPSSDAAHWNSRLVGASGWDAAAFIDLCETAERSSDDDLTTAAKRIQWAEMLILLEHTYRQASGQ
jgi:hypothetical protein